MPSTRQYPIRLGMVRGVDTTSEPHLVEDTRWTVSHNVRAVNTKVTSIPRKRNYTQIVNDSLEVRLIAAIPTETRNEALIVCLTQKHAYQLVTPNGPHTVLALNGVPSDFTHFTTLYTRWSAVMYNKQLYVTNESNPLFRCDGTQCKRDTGDLPSARYVETFFDHIFVACSTFKGDYRPTRVQWSDLFKPAVWSPAVSNEAGEFDIEEWVLPDFSLVGVTGLKRMGDLLVAYTPSSIIGITYVGLPKIVRFAPIATNVGNAFKYGLAWHKEVHYFFDGVTQNFCEFSSEGVKYTGGPILSYFGSNLTTNYDLMQRTWAFSRPEKFEIWWLFCSRASSGELDLAVVYNWASQSWYHTSVENITAFGGMAKRARTMDELTGPMDTLSGQGAFIDELSFLTEDPVPRIFGTVNSWTKREEVATDRINDLDTQSDPTLETKDYLYGGLFYLSEVDGICIHSNYDAGDGIEVSVSARMNLEDTVEWKVVGLWKPDLPESTLTFSAISGRVFRYRFRLVGSPKTNFYGSYSGGRNWRFGGFSEGVYTRQEAEK